MFGLTELVVLNAASSVHVAWPIATLLAAGATLPLAVRRRAPLPVLAVTGSSLLVLIALGAAPGVAGLGPMVAFYTVVTSCGRRVSLAAGAIAAVGLVAAEAAAEATRQGSTAVTLLLVPVVVLAVVWLASDNVRVRRAYVAELGARVERAEADRERETARAAERERLRIARELHDVIAHNVSVIAIQAAGLRLRHNPDETSETDADVAVDAIERTSRQTLTELRRLLGVLRHDGLPGAELAPQPGLAQLDELIARVRRAGLPITVHLQGQPVALPQALDLSAYRLIQEALTNVLKHQGAAPTDVVIRYGNDQLSICVRNLGGTADAVDVEHVGHGLIGMRERVAMFGGRLSAGPRPDRGYEVVAQLPLMWSR